MALPEEPGTVSETPATPIKEMLEEANLPAALRSEEFKRCLDQIPIAVLITREAGETVRVAYANAAFQKLIDHSPPDQSNIEWSILAEFKNEDESNTLQDALLKGEEEFLGRFKHDILPLEVEAYSASVENEDGTQEYRVAALINVTDRGREEREDLARQVRDRDTLLKELQHRVKNNLQLVVALIRMEARNERRGDKVNLAALAGRIESLQLLYQALTPDEQGGEIDLGHYLSQIAASVVNTHAVKGVRLDLKVDHTPVSINRALPVGLVVNELLTNSFKYAFADRETGVVAVECLRTEKGTFRIVVADDGSGLPPGKQWPVPGKIGALIVQTLRENTAAEINVESRSGEGLRVTIEFSSNTGQKKNS